MKEILSQFQTYLNDENKEEAVRYILSKLQSKDIDVIDLYRNILTTSLNHIVCRPGEENTAIYREHIKTAIVRTILECSYPYILEKRDELALDRKGKVIVLCPPEEYHDLGARMAADFFIIAGYETVFVGSNTPYQDVYHVLGSIRPEFIAISVSSLLNLVSAKKMIHELKQIPNLKTKIVVGGYAFHDDPDKYKIIGADYFVNTYEEILNLAGNGVIV